MNAMFDKPGIITNASEMRYQANAPGAGLPNPRMPLSGDWSEALHEPFVRQAQRVGGFAKIAIIGHDQSISYAQLDRLSNQLAHYLGAHDCCGKVVAIYATRSPALVWAMLGVLKAGAAFLVLDSAYPVARLAEYCRQAQPRALIQLEEAGALPSELLDAPTHRLILPKTLAAASQLLAEYSDSAPNTKVGPNDLAYVMFTSGSTGKPKGILGTHAPPAHFMAWHIRTFGFTESERFSMLSGLAHDIVLRDIFAPLSVGATLCIPHPDEFSPGRISAWIRENKITVAHLTPPRGHLISADETTFESLRYLFFGGDKLPTSLVEKLHKLAPNVTCVNFYGATETPQAMGYFVVPRHRLNRSVVPVGRGIGNVQLLVLTSQLELAGIEEVGEIAIRTPYLALGYLGDEVATSEKFMLNPFTRPSAGSGTSQKGDRLYRTGDLGRYLPESCGTGSGNVEILGRQDRQVQLRGARIELSELEAALNAHENVRQSVVLLQERAKGQYLVAYVVVQDSIAKEWRAYLRERFPNYMVPNNLICLEHFPLTPNGKIDYSALPEPTYLREKVVGPRTPIEEGLVQIWQDVLQVEPVGVYENFLELGGHSLLAVQVISRVRDTFRVELPLRLLLEYYTVANMASQIERAQTAQTGQNVLPSIEVVSRDEPLPLSFSQLRLWFLEQLEETSATYNILLTRRLVGELNINALQESLSEVVRRHESLRTTFTFLDGEPKQIIHIPTQLSLPVVDLTKLTRAEREATTRRIRQQEAQRPFDLSHAPLFRVTLLKLTTEKHMLLCAMHHIISDAWSSRIFMRELFTLYDAYSQNKPTILPDLPIQYADFACWQQERLSEEVSRQLVYWKEHLAGGLPILELPRDYARPTRQAFTGGSLSLKLPEALSEALLALSQGEGATLFMTLLAAFNTLLYRITGQEDILVGTPIAGRNRAELEGLIGFFINTLVLRCNVSATSTFRELLGHVRQVALDAYAHQDVPFEKLVEELQPPRDLSRTPIFQVWVNMSNPTSSSSEQVAGLTVQRAGLGEGGAKFDLSLYISSGAQIGLQLVYNTELFSEARIELMLTHLQTLLEGIVAAPDAPISSYRLPPAKGRNLVQPSNPFIPFPTDAIEQSIPSRFAEQVRKSPHQIAVKTKRYECTYKELNEQANQVAQAIIDLISGAGRIALLFEHDAPMIAGMLGVLKAGKTYVPLDPTYPRERLLYMLEDSQAQAIVTNNQNIAYAQEFSGGTLPLINLDEPEIRHCSEINLTISPDTLAYILYTSGSTGQPKGVMQTHRNVLHFMRSYTNNLHISATDKLTLLSSYSFDAAIMDIFGALFNGATLYPFDLKQNTLQELVECLIEEEMTIYHSTPTVYRHLINTLTGDEPFPHLRLVVMGGEAVYKPDVESYKKHFSDECLFVNGLGPTESTVTLQYFINKQTNLSRHAVPVGYPVDKTEILLLNEAGQESDFYGEIAIRSEHVALGYWRKEEKSAAVFLPDPEGSKKRLYRMGDLGRYLPDGSLEFVGRKDTQVKIRGYRIELGEVESALSQHPAVEENAVILWEDAAADNKQLVAYLVCSEPVSSVELRDFMRQKLPTYMVPQAFFQLEVLPQTPTSKVDRRALPAPKLSRERLEKEFVVPRTPTEELLAAIFCQVLQIPKVGITDNFFELGGHSLLAVQVIWRMRTAFSVNLPLRHLFEFPTIAELSKVLQNLTQSEADPIMPVPRDSVLPLSFAQRRLWDWQQLAGESATYKISHFRRLSGSLNLMAAEQSFSLLVRRHESLRTTFPELEGGPMQFIHPADPSASSGTALLDPEPVEGSPEEQERQMRHLAHENAFKPFDLAKGPLFRITWLRLGAEEHLLLLTFHHIIIDGWSRRRLFREWSTLYEAISQGKPSPLPEMSLQYADFAHWQRHSLPDDYVAEQLAYWKEQLGGQIPVLRFPQDDVPSTQPIPRSSRHAFRGERQAISLSKPLADALKRLSQQEGSTLFMTMLAAFKALLYHKTGQEDLIIGSPNANRTRPEVQDVVGYFVNPLALRTSLQGNPCFRELLRRVRQVVLGAYAHQEIPFEKIVSELHPERDLNRDPIFAVWFNMLNLEKQALDLSGVIVEPIKLTNKPTAMFDLTLSIREVHESDSLAHEATRGGLQLNLIYKADRFGKAEMAQLLAQYQKLLVRVTEQPDTWLSELLPKECASRTGMPARSLTLGVKEIVKPC